MLDFLGTGRHSSAVTAVHHGDLRAETKGTTNSITSDVTGTDNNNMLAREDGSIGVEGEGVGLHEIDTGEELVGRVDTREGFARDAEEAGKTGTDTDESGVVVALEELSYATYGE